MHISRIENYCWLNLNVICWWMIFALLGSLAIIRHKYWHSFTDNPQLHYIRRTHMALSFVYSIIIDIILLYLLLENELSQRRSQIFLKLLYPDLYKFDIGIHFYLILVSISSHCWLTFYNFFLILYHF